MSDLSSDAKPIADLSVTAKSGLDQSTDALSLSELSDRDRVWDKHKANSDCVSDHYAKSQYHRFSERINICSDLLDFCLVPESDQGVYKLKLAAARFCRVRHCPVCQWRRSLMWKAKAYQALPKVVADFPKCRWLFLTLTLKNCPITELRSTLDWVNKSFVRLTKLKDFPAIGWIKSVEVTRGKDGNAHPHIHALLMVRPSYFGAGYLSQERWEDLWQQSLRVDYKPICHVRAIAKQHGMPELGSPATLVRGGKATSRL